MQPKHKGNMNEELGPKLFKFDPKIRYVSINRNGTIVEMTQNPDLPMYNPHDTDRTEELVVNPTVLDLLRRRGSLDQYGVKFVVIHYDEFYQVVMPYEDGHLSIGVELTADVIDVVKRVTKLLDIPI